MGLLSELFGGKKGARPAQREIADVETAIHRLAAERRDARDAIADAIRRREELLLDDTSDAKIAELDAATDKRRLRLKRLDKAEPLLIDELQALRSEKRRETWRRISKRYNEASRELVVKMRDAIEQRKAVVAIVEEAQNGGFSAEAAHFVFSPHILDELLLAQFESGLDRLRDADARAAKPSPPAPAPPAEANSKPIFPIGNAAPSRTAAAVVSAPKLLPPPNAPPPRPPFTPTPDAEGKVDVAFVRSGFEIEGVGPSKAGKTYALTLDQAYAAVRAGAAEFAGTF